jgi:hypothetical protein
MAKPGCFFWAWVGVFGFFAAAVLSTFVWQVVDPEGYAAMRAEQAAEKSATEQAAAAELAVASEADAEERLLGRHCLSGWDGSNSDFKHQVQAMARNPDSFEHVETVIYPLDPTSQVDGRGGEHGAWMTYRAQNGFGGMNVERIYARISHEHCMARVLPGGPGTG